MRHAFATRCIESGVNAAVLQRLLGHTDISITLNTYTSIFNLFKDNELEKVIELYKNNSLGLVQNDYKENFQNGTEEIYIDEKDDEMEF